MKTNLVARACAFLAVFCTLPASAGVIYRWQDVTPNPNIGLFSGYIEFSEAVWSPDGQFFMRGASSPEASLEPILGIEHFFWSNPNGIGFTSRIDAIERPCSVWEPAGGCASIGLSDDDLVLTPVALAEGFGGTFDFTFGSVLTGFLHTGDGTTDVQMSSVGPLWTIERTGSDGPGICFDNDGRCWGSAGLWVLDLSTLPAVSVSEPSTSVLMLLSIVALLACRMLNRANKFRRGQLARTSAALALIISSMPASAGVIYRWQDITPDPEAGAFEGYIEFSDAAWRPGGHLFQEGSFNGTPGSLRPTQDIERFTWTNPSGLGFGVFQGIGMALTPCSALDAALQDYCEPGDTFLTSGHTGVRFDFDITFGALLTGALSVDTDQAFVRMGSGSGPLWTIGGTASEVGGACYSLFPTGCSGSTGIWLLDLSTVPTSVPEPSTAGLMLLGLSALLAARLQRRRSVSIAARISISVALLISAIPASAGVIYRWQDITENPNIGAFFGEIEFSYDVWSPGGNISERGATDGILDPIFGIEHFYWSNPSGLGFINRIESTARQCSAFPQHYDCESLGLPGDTLVWFPLTGVGGGPAQANFQLTFGSLLEGTLSYNDSTTEVHMGSAGPLWTINRTGSEGNGGICFQNDGRCWGSTGLWVLDLSTLPPVRVPEPPTTLLAMLAAAALLVRRKFDRA